MDETVKKQEWLALVALMGAAGALLFCNSQGFFLPCWGPNVLVWVGLALAGLLWTAHRAGIALRGDGLWFAAPLCFFAASFFLREDTFLRFWNGVFMLVSGALLITRSRGPWRVSLAGYTEYIRLCALAAAYTLAGPFAALGGSKNTAGDQPPRVALPNSRLGSIGKIAPIAGAQRSTAEETSVIQNAAASAAAAEVDSWFIPAEPAPVPMLMSASASESAPAMPLEAGSAAVSSAAVLPHPKGFVTPIAVLKGILLSAVPLLVFGCLFASADPVFGHLWDDLFNWNIGALARQVVWGALLGLVGIGLLHTALQREPAPDQTDRGILPDSSAAPRTLTAFFQQGSDVVVALILIDLLFAAFVAVQFNFLFGGADVVRSVPGLHYAAYARGGFFELAWVAALALPVLLFSHWITRASPDAAKRRVRQRLDLAAVRDCRLGIQAHGIVRIRARPHREPPAGERLYRIDYGSLRLVFGNHVARQATTLRHWPALRRDADRRRVGPGQYRFNRRAGGRASSGRLKRV